ncbi:RTA1 like protein [Cordyceps fumosorosea ARSEF 2679]|uniref:RTA1 like protein n=1 Tax=Cordyceps fumosorosea (strain ARSEF 2679) TaxID=1081104 RepID=A0A168CKR1_CORFA|nr:RTA1 like protein [Cordyceps fumosorosea ARSEF 2679]OAA71495.1 RTA1 like protein [Cordyceps fumosorosea ARSEF 2679]
MVLASRPSGYVDPSFTSPHGPHDPVIIYGFTPFLVLAAFAAAFFALLLLLHTLQAARYRTWWFLPFSLGLAFEVADYAARALSAAHDPYHLVYFVLNYFFVVTAPVFLAASICTVLSVLIALSDVLATAAQVAGAAMIGKREADRRDPTTANNVLLGGLAYQVFSMGVYVVVSGVLLWRARDDLRRDGLVGFAWAFAAATALIYLRTAFRLAETAEGLFGNLQTHEIYVACLEFAPVALAVLLFGCFHPGRCIKSDAAEAEEKLPHRDVPYV